MKDAIDLKAASAMRERGRGELCRSLCQAGAYLPNKLSLWPISQRHNTFNDGLASRSNHSWVTAVTSTARR